MNAVAASRKAIAASPIAAATIYVGILVVLLFVTATSLAGILDQRSQVASASAMLKQFESHRLAATHSAPGDVTVPTGSAYLEGATVTIAGAALLQRVAGAVAKFDGNVLSSQLDLQGTPSHTGFLTMIASCEIEQSKLQPLLYDLEAGMPFLFVDQLVVQTPSAASDSANSRLRVLLAVSGQWQGVK